MIWKTFAGRCIHHGKNGIRVRQNITYRWLTFDSDAIQTLIHRRHPERCGLQYIQTLTLVARVCPGPSCLLGLGGAGVAHALASYFEDFPIDAIDSSLEVIEIASRYFMTEQIKNLNIIHQDAFLHVQNTKVLYQHLIVDLFSAHSFPEHCNNADFFDHCRSILLPDGVLAVNLANLHEQWPIFKQIRVHFPHCTVCIPVKNTANMIVLAYKGSSVRPLLKMLEINTVIKQLTWDSKWGCIAIFE